MLALLIATLCLMPARDLPGPGISDKLVHGIAFAALGFWFGSLLVRRAFPALVAALLAFGALIEGAQGLMNLGREPELLDFAADAGGVAAGLLLCLTPLARWPRWLEAWIPKGAT